MFGPQDQGFNIFVIDALFAIGQGLEFHEEFVELLTLHRKPQCLQPVTERMPAAVFAQHQRVFGHANALGFHDFIGFRILEHAVLVDAGLVRECVATDNGLVGLDARAGYGRHYATGRVELRGIDAGFELVVVIPCAQRHYHFLQRAVAGALPDSVDRAFHLAGAALDGAQAVGYGQAQVVVIMAAENHRLSVVQIVSQVLIQLTAFTRSDVANCIWNIQHPGSGIHGRLEIFHQVVDFRTAGVFSGDLDVIEPLLAKFHG